MEEMKKQLTAVEWLVEQICGDHTEQWQKEIEQAKEMEREQIINSFICGNNCTPFILTLEENAEQYYTQTFKSE